MKQQTDQVEATQVYSTIDTGFAIMLATCGVPIPQEPENAEGNRPRIPFINWYDKRLLEKHRDKLKKAGLRLGADLFEAAILAHRIGIRGNIIYLFLRTALLDELSKTWTGQSKLIEMGEKEGNPLATIPAGWNRNQVCQLACLLSTNRKWYVEGWRKVVPHVNLPGNFEIEKEGGKVYAVGSCQFLSVNCSEATKRSLGIKF